MTKPHALWIVSALVVALVAWTADAAVVEFGPYDVPSMFHISRTNNRNEVHYGIRLREACQPASATPVFAYWRELEVGPEAISSLLEREQAPYGIAPEQEVVTRGGRSRVHFRLNAFPDRPLVAVVGTARGRCIANVIAQVEARPAILSHIHVVLGILWTVDRIEIHGLARDSRASLIEVIDE